MASEERGRRDNGGWERWPTAVSRDRLVGFKFKFYCSLSVPCFRPLNQVYSQQPPHGVAVKSTEAQSQVIGDS